MIGGKLKDRAEGGREGKTQDSSGDEIREV